METEKTPFNVIEIEGIEDAFSAVVNGVGIIDTNDLLLYTPDKLYRILKMQVSLQQCSRFIQAARLLQVQGMTGKYAEALITAGITSIEFLAKANFDKLKSAFTDGAQMQLIPQAPADSEIFGMAKDALSIYLTRMIIGEVKDSDGLPVSNATIFYSYHKAITNSNGRFRLLRLPPDKNIKVMIQLEESEVHQIKKLLAATDNLSRFINSIQLGTNTREMEDHDELLGEKIPGFKGVVYSSLVHETSEMRDHDLLVLISFYSGNTDAKLTSVFRKLSNGKIEIRSYRVPVSKLPEGARTKDAFLYKDGIFKRVKVNPRMIELWRRLRVLSKSKKLQKKNIPKNILKLA